eukprot:TRINITY_DN145_c3_g1_i1.p1 TRINITY_DN145_c3_g1~~TRINITY_DN145_c3_g1_i1.p1  ORF type:complete len:104 (-),score=9.23 TRINITY_DN145_c3_g1_i1:535-846(-)
MPSVSCHTYFFSQDIEYINSDRNIIFPPLENFRLHVNFFSPKGEREKGEKGRKEWVKSRKEFLFFFPKERERSRETKKEKKENMVSERKEKRKEKKKRHRPGK